MKQLIILLAILILFPNFINAQNTPSINEVSERTYQKLTSHNSISYEVSHKNKIYWDSDTTMSTGSCQIVRNELDSFYPAYVRYTIDNRLVDVTADKNKEILTQPLQEYIYHNYDLTVKYQQIYDDVAWNDLRVYKQDPLKIGGLPNAYMVNYYFLYPDIFKKLALEAQILEVVTIDRQDVWYINIKKEDNEKFRDRKIEFWISVEDYSILKIAEQYQFQNFDGIQYIEWNFQNIEYGKVTSNEIVSQSLDNLALYHETTYQFFKQKRTSLIKKDQIAPFFIGWNILENREVSITEYSDAPVVLYFWDRNSQSEALLEYINDLSTEYAPYGIVFLGIISEESYMHHFKNGSTNRTFDENGDFRSKQVVNNTSEGIFEVLQEKSIAFTNILVPNNVFDEFGTIGYPEVIILGKDGNIQKTFSGLHQLNKIELEKSLEVLVK